MRKAARADRRRRRRHGRDHRQRARGRRLRDRGRRTAAPRRWSASPQEPADVVITDLRMKNVDGLDVLRGRQARRSRRCRCIIMTAFGAIDSAVEAMRRGAFHYVTKPFELEALRVAGRARLPRARRSSRENALLRRTLRANAVAQRLLGQSAPMRQLRALIERVAGASSSVLISGETGTGKELVALAMHADSARADKPFVAVNCAALPEQLLESELFGHARGAFTGASQSRRGLFVEADERDAVPRRDRRSAAAAAGQAAARAAVGRGAPGRQRAEPPRRRALRGGHAQGSRRAGREGPVPRGSVLPPRRAARAGAGAARARRRHPDAGRALPAQEPARRAALGAGRLRARGAGLPDRLRLAGQRAPAREPDRAAGRDRARRRWRASQDVQQALGPVRDVDPIAPLLQKPLRWTSSRAATSRRSSSGSAAASSRRPRSWASTPRPCIAAKNRAAERVADGARCETPMRAASWQTPCRQSCVQRERQPYWQGFRQRSRLSLRCFAAVAALFRAGFSAPDRRRVSAPRMRP